MSSGVGPGLPAGRCTGILLAFLLLWSLLVFLGPTRLGFLDNEGRYAEVAREMLLTGDWITPHLNGERFLNKPPWTFWLTALWFRLVAMDESARAIPGAAALLTTLVVYGLGRRLAGQEAGLWSGVVYATATLTLQEARTLRPDGWFVLAFWLTLLGAARARDESRGFARPGWGAYLFWGGVALGLLVKGFLALLLPCLTLGAAAALAGFRDGGARGVSARLAEFRVLLAWSTWGLGLLVALPWHGAAAAANPGFAYDYVVNQHLLFFLDRKFPRDSVPDPLWYVWAVFLGRCFPWILLAPFLLRRAAPHGPLARDAVQWLPTAAAGSVLGLFSLSRSHLEHYFLPAVPAVALLAGPVLARWCRDQREDGPGAPGRGAGLLLAGMGGVGWLVVPGVLARTGYLGLVPAAAWLAPACFSCLIAGGVVLELLARRGCRTAALAVLAAVALAVQGLAEEGRVRSAPLLTPRELIRSQPLELRQESTPVYEAGEEYQLCGVLNFYLRRRVLLPEPPGFIPPTYLARDVQRLFEPRAAFLARWRAGRERFLLFTNPELPLDRREAFPQPWYEVARGGGRQLLTNLPWKKVSPPY